MLKKYKKDALKAGLAVGKTGLTGEHAFKLSYAFPLLENHFVKNSANFSSLFLTSKWYD